jgi:hypothetical protein
MRYDGPYLLDLFNRMAGRSSTDSVQPAAKYTWLSEAQDEVVLEIATVCPWTLYPKVGTASMPQLVTTDQNVFTFGLDGDAQPIVPFGDAQIFRRLSDIPDAPLRPGWDYINEGDQIRMPRNRHFTATLYWRGIVMPPAISDTQAGAFIPKELNSLTAIRAVQNFAESGNLRNAPLADRMKARWAQRWPRSLLMLKRQFSKGGAMVIWTARDLVTPLL